MGAYLEPGGGLTDALVLKYQASSIPRADKLYILLDQNFTFTVNIEKPK